MICAGSCGGVPGSLRESGVVVFQLSLNLNHAIRGEQSGLPHQTLARAQRLRVVREFLGR